MVLGSIGWTAYETGLPAFLIAQIVILLTPAVRHRVGRGQQGGRWR
jgi:hypothetical protein